MNLGRPLGPVARFIVRPDGVVIAAVAAIMLLWSFWEWSGREKAYFDVTDVTWMVWFGLFSIRVIRSILRRIIRGVYRQPRNIVFAGRRYRWFVTGVFASSVLLAVYDVPLRVRFWVSKPALDRYANHLYCDVPMLDPPAGPRQMGLFWTDSAHAGPNYVYITGRRHLTYLPQGMHVSWWTYLASPWTPAWSETPLSEHWEAY
jgi:hypothetical protein